MTGAGGRLVLDPGILEEVVGHARACLPQEACGFLAGRGESVRRFIPARNMLRSATAYAVEPQFLLDLMRGLRLSGEDLVAIYHSHPLGPARPSDRDVAEARYPSSAHLIVSLAGAEPEVRAFRITGGKVLEVEVHAIV